MSLDRSLRMKRFADRVQASEKNVLQYNRDHGKLVPWGWCVLSVALS